MKVLRIEMENLPLFNETFVLDFLATQRVTDSNKEHLIPLGGTCLFANPVEAVVGINASGKTSALKALLFALRLFNNEPINYTKERIILNKEGTTIVRIYFYGGDNELGLLETHICPDQSSYGDRFIIDNEFLKLKRITPYSIKKSVYDFDDVDVAATRSKEAFLSDDVSFIIAYHKAHSSKLMIEDMLAFTDMNALPDFREIPYQTLSFLDSSIEYIHIGEPKNGEGVTLKFQGKEEIRLQHVHELNRYLSSGTIKGIVAFSLAQKALRHGGYLVIDELENHFNKEIAATLIRLFLDASFNSRGGTLIFSTHYPELLDEFDRNDSICLTTNDNGLRLENLSTLLHRSDIKKSDAYESGAFGDTTPSYKAYTAMKKMMAEQIKGELDL